MSQDCCHNKKKKRDKVKNADQVIWWLMGGTVVMTLLVVFLGMKVGKGVEVRADSEAAVTVESNAFDWGEIDIDGGVVTKTFSIKNSGSSTLKLYDVKTSCMCTTAQLKTANATSKKFGMHEKNSSVFEVKPGETAELRVEFDPAFHGPSGVGPIRRTVSMSTNAKDSPSLSFQLAALVVNK